MIVGRDSLKFANETDSGFIQYITLVVMFSIILFVH